MIKKTFICATIVLLSIFGKFAQSQPADARRGLARTPSEHYILAEDLLKSKQYLKAAEHYQQSDVDEHPASLYNAAVCYERARSVREALNLYQRYLRKMAEKVPDAKIVEDARKRVAEISLSEANESFNARRYGIAVRAAQSILPKVDSLDLFRETHLLIGKAMCAEIGAIHPIAESYRALDELRQKSLLDYCWTKRMAYDGTNFYRFKNRLGDTATVPPESAKRIDDNAYLIQLSSDGEPIQNSEFQPNSARAAIISGIVLRKVISPNGGGTTVQAYGLDFDKSRVQENSVRRGDWYSDEILNCIKYMKKGLTYRCYINRWRPLSVARWTPIAEHRESIQAVDIYVERFE